METAGHSKHGHLNLDEIESLVHHGKTVVSSEESTIIETVFRALEEGKTATFYLKPSIFSAIQKRYWTPDRVDAVGLRPITDEEAARVKADFGIVVDGFANTINCPRCGHGYGTYEFIEQGIREHGEELVKRVFATKWIAIVQVNPAQEPICPQCALHLSVSIGRGPGIGRAGGYFYNYACKEGNAYACCQ